MSSAVGISEVFPVCARVYGNSLCIASLLESAMWPLYSISFKMGTFFWAVTLCSYLKLRRNILTPSTGLKNEARNKKQAVRITYISTLMMEAVCSMNYRPTSQRTALLQSTLSELQIQHFTWNLFPSEMLKGSATICRQLLNVTLCNFLFFNLRNWTSWLLPIQALCYKPECRGFDSR
jgi:hypothetical protein